MKLPIINFSFSVKRGPSYHERSSAFITVRFRLLSLLQFFHLSRFRVITRLVSSSKVISGVVYPSCFVPFQHFGSLFLTITENVFSKASSLSAVIACIFYLCRPIICNVRSVVRWLVFSLSANS